MRMINWLVVAAMVGGCSGVWAEAKIPESARKFLERGNEFVKRESYTRAKGEYQKALQAYPAFKDALYNLAVVCEQLGQTDEAVAAYQQYLELSPASADVWTQLGVLSDTRGDKAGAAAAYRKALEANPKFGRAHHNLGVLLAEQGQEAAGRRHLETFVALEEGLGRKNGDAYYSMGVFHLQRGRGRDAKVWLQKALDVDPAQLLYNNAMGDVYLLEKQPDVARVYFQKVIAQDPKFALAYSGMGDAQRQLGAVDEAAAAYRQALALRPDYPVVEYKLGLLYETTAPALAIKHFENYLKSGTTLEYADEVKAKLVVLKQFHEH